MTSYAFRYGSRLCALAAMAFSALSVWGWFNGVPILASFGRHLIPMAPMSAVGILILGLLALIPVDATTLPSKRLLRRLVAATVALAALAVCIQFLRGESWRVESYLVRESSASGFFQIGRLSPITVVFFLMTGFAEFFNTFPNLPKSKNIVVSFTLSVLISDTVVLLGYLHHTPLLYGATIIPMALTTALAFAFLNLGILLTTAPQAFPWTYLAGSSARAILLRSLLPISLALVFANGLIHKALPATWNPGLVGAISALILGVGMTFVISNVAVLLGNAIDRAEKRSDDAERALRRAHGDLIETYDRTLEGWAKALDLRDQNTHHHCQRVAELTLKLAYAMGVDPEQMIHIRRGALLHDIGKMGLPDNILLKNGQLTEDEWAIMRLHPQYAYQLLSPIEYLRPALAIPYSHHERWDGTGYPQGLKGEEIPLIARLFSVVDIWDALTSARPYKVPWTEERARAHLLSLSGKHLDANAVDAFLKLDLSKTSEATIHHAA